MSLQTRTINACAMLILGASCSTIATAEEPADLIQGVVARSQAIVSGRLDYTFTSARIKRGQATQSTRLPQARVSFSESSWAERVEGGQVTRINHGGYFLEFVQTPQRDGSSRPGATILPPKALASRGELNAPPLFAGLFWHDEQLRYVEKHASECRLTGTREVNGVAVEVLELDVPGASHREAFHVFSPQLAAGGVIRLCVAPQLGYVLPRIEFLNRSNQVALSWNASGFSEVAPAISLPDRIWAQTHPPDGGGYRAEFTIHSELINQEIPLEDFSVDLPPKTKVQDAQQAGQVITFDLTEAGSSRDFHAIVDHETAPRYGLLQRWRNAIIMGAALGMVATISLYFSSRKQRRRDRNTGPAGNSFGRSHEAVASPGAGDGRHA
jgi:hypothetical protein